MGSWCSYWGILTIVFATHHLVAAAFAGAGLASLLTAFTNPKVEQIELQPNQDEKPPKFWQVLTALPPLAIVSNLNLNGVIFGAFCCITLVQRAGPCEALVLLTISSLIKLLVSIFVGRSMDNVDSRKTLIICGLGSFVLPVFSLFIKGYAMGLASIKALFDATESGLVVGIDSNLARDVAQGWPYLNTACFEAARGIDDLVAYSLMIIVVLNHIDAMAYLVLACTFSAIVRMLYALDRTQISNGTIQ